MKKLKYLIFLLILTVIFPTFVDAASSVSISVKCSNVNVGETTTCTISGTSSSLSAIDAKLSLSGGATITGITPGGGFTALENTAAGNSGSIVYGTGDDKSGTFTIATVNIQGNSAGTATLKVSNITASVDNSALDVSASPAQKSFNVIAPQTAPVTEAPTQPATTKPVTTTVKVNTTTQKITSTEIATTVPTGTLLVLDSVKVGDFPVNFQDNKYYVTVKYDTTSVNIEATANPLITIIGVGEKNLAVGKNAFDLVLKNELNQSTIVQVIVTRPEDTNEYDTKLTSLKVVGHPFEFNPNTKEYTIDVDSNEKEIYVIAEAPNVDISIIGAGLKTLKDKDNDIHIISQYGEKSSTEYIIHIKKNYQTIYMWIAIGLLGTGCIGLGSYFIVFKRKAKKDIKAASNKVVADVKRENDLTKQQAVINGESATGLLSQTNNEPIERKIPGNLQPQQVIKKTIPTNPVTIATSGVQPLEKKVIPQQVKVVTKQVTPSQVQEVKTIHTIKSDNYNNDKIIINTTK